MFGACPNGLRGILADELPLRPLAKPLDDAGGEGGGGVDTENTVDLALGGVEGAGGDVKRLTNLGAARAIEQLNRDVGARIVQAMQATEGTGSVVEGGYLGTHPQQLPVRKNAAGNRRKRNAAGNSDCGEGQAGKRSDRGDTGHRACESQELSANQKGLYKRRPRDDSDAA